MRWRTEPFGTCIEAVEVEARKIHRISLFVFVVTKMTIHAKPAAPNDADTFRPEEKILEIGGAVISV